MIFELMLSLLLGFGLGLFVGILLIKSLEEKNQYDDYDSMIDVNHSR